MTERNVAESVKQRLLNQMKATGRPFDELLRYFGMERFLYRLGRTPHVNDFVLKGAMMLRMLDAPHARSTADIDLMGKAELDAEGLSRVVEDCFNVPGNDGLTFDRKSLRTEAIRLHHNYHGVRCQFDGLLLRTKIPIQIDIGFGDAMVPAPIRIDYPSLLDFPAPSIWVYSIETAIAEKFEAMVLLAEVNSRMKDFYDIWLLSTQRNFDAETLTKSIQATFKRRGTELPSSLPLALRPDFYDLPVKKSQWKAFLRKILRPDQISLEDVAKQLEPFLMRPVQSILQKKPMRAKWLPAEGWVEKN